MEYMLLSLKDTTKSVTQNGCYGDTKSNCFKCIVSHISSKER